jgi:fatty acid desaturase
MSQGTHRETGRGDLGALRRTLHAAGAFEHRTGATWLKFAALLSATFALGVVAAVVPLAAGLLLVPVVALPLTSAVMIGHEGGHRSFARSPWQNELMLHLAFPLLAGLGAQHWKRKHNAIHHGHPNVIGIDDDIDLWPFALEPREHARAGRFRRWFHRRLQGALFFPLAAFLGFVMRRASVRHTVRVLRRGEASWAWFADAACQVAHYALWLVVPGLLVGWLPTLAVYLGLWGCVGVYLALVFTPAHLGLPLVEGDPRGWRHQLETTRNLVLPRWIAWAFIGLDHQVEHHLFPTIPHQNMARARAILQPWCVANAAPHLAIGYGAGVREVIRFMRTSWRRPDEIAGSRRAA